MKKNVRRFEEDTKFADSVMTLSEAFKILGLDENEYKTAEPNTLVKV